MKILYSFCKMSFERGLEGRGLAGRTNLEEQHYSTGLNRGARVGGVPAGNRQLGWVTRTWRPVGHFEKLPSGQWAWLQLQAIHTRMFLACWTQAPYSALCPPHI